mgnify:CR=1 FL=1
MALFAAANELVYLRKVMRDLDKEFDKPVRLFEDNQSAIKMIKNYQNNSRVKHIEVKCSQLIDLCEKGICTIMFVSSSNQLADITTKKVPDSKVG